MPPPLREGVCCLTRQTAQALGEFWPAARLGGWVMREPYEPGRPITHPFVWTFCPFCGADLPGPPQPPKPDDAANPYKDTDD